MATTALQQEVFSPERERLVGLVLVMTGGGRKRKQSYLCATVSSDHAQQAYIHKVKKPSEKEPYKKKTSWKLQDLREVDGKDPSPDNCDFDLRFDKVYKWTAARASEKKAFVLCLWKLCHKLLGKGKKPEFVNVNKQKLEEQLKTFDPSRFGATATPAVVEEEYQELTPKEEADLERILTTCNSSISNAEAFTDTLVEQLDELDMANRTAIMKSENEVDALLQTMDSALQELDKVDHEMETYDCLLQDVREAVEEMDDKDKQLQIEDENYRRLLEEVQSLVDKLDIGLEAEELLRHGDLNNRTSLERCTEAALALQRARNVKLSPGMNMLSAVMQQKQSFNQLAWAFIKRLSTHLTGQFTKQGDDGMDVMGQRRANPQLLILRSHNSYHRDLLPYSKLMGWLREVDAQQYVDLYKAYVSFLGKVYEKEIKEFMESVKQSLLGKYHDHKKGFKLSISNASLVKSGSRESLHSSGNRSSAAPSASLLDLTSRFRDKHDSASLGPTASADERQKFDNAFVMVLEQLDPLCKDEQDFCTEFFALKRETDGGADAKDTPGQDSPDSYWARRKKSRSDKSAKSPASALTSKRMMEEIFSTLEFELQRLIEFGDKLDGFNSLCMLVRVSQHVRLGKTSDDQARTSYLSLCLGKHLIIVKRLFDNFVAGRVRWTEELKVPKKHKCGILPCVTKFEEFATQAEDIIRGSDRRADLDKAYKALMDATVGAIDRISADHQKTPSDVIVFENFHHLSDMLARLKISCLDAIRDQAKQQYKVHVDSYVRTYLGKPLDKLSTFIEGIQNLVASGVKHEEVGYQLAFSKAELKKLIREYPGERVKRGLEFLYRKAEKHLCEEENLLQVVWHSMQEKFLLHYKEYEELVEKCYPGSKIILEFSLDDLLSYFSMIARQHY